MEEVSRYKKASRVTIQGLLLNLGLFLLKVFAGLTANSGAIVADAFHSLSDLSTDFALLWGNQVAAKPADEDHQYGHGRVETMVSAGIGIFLFGVGSVIFFEGAQKIIQVFGGEVLVRPGWFAVLAAVISVILKEWIYRRTIIVGRETQNQALIANAWHHRSDALSSIGVMLGVSGAILLGDQWNILDPIAAIVVSFFIIKTAYSVIGESFYELMEGSLSCDQEREIMDLVQGVDGAEQAHKLRTRRIGPKIAIDLHIKVNNDLNIQQAHDIATEVENILKNHFGYGTFVSIHVEPLEE